MQRRTFLGAGALALLSACTDERKTRSMGSVGTPLVSPVVSRHVVLDDVLAWRRSVRSFSDTRVDDAAVSRLLWAAQGVTASWGGRTAPSAGALYPIELYAADSDSLRRYVPELNGSIEVAREDRRARIAEATGQEPPSTAPVLIVITGVISRTATKYGDRAERYVLLEAGHACQNLLLEVTALGLAAVPIGAFSDDGVRDALGVATDELPVYVVPVGHPA